MAKQTTREYLGEFEDFARVKAAALAAGCTEDGSYLDYVEARDHQSRKKFTTKDEAVEWVKANILADKTTFGCGDVIEGEPVSAQNRCRYCTCNGWKQISRTIVEDTGPLDEEPLDNDCLD